MVRTGEGETYSGEMGADFRFLIIFGVVLKQKKNTCIDLRQIRCFIWFDRFEGG